MDFVQLFVKAVGVLLVAFSLWIAAMNYFIVWKKLRGLEERMSTFPLIGGVAGVAGLWILFAPHGSWMVWLPVFLDPGCAYYLIGALGYTIYEGIKKLVGK